MYMLKKAPPRASDGLNLSYQMCILSKGSSRPPLIDNLIFTDYLKVIQNIYTEFPLLPKRCFNYHALTGVINCVLIQNQIKIPPTPSHTMLSIPTPPNCCSPFTWAASPGNLWEQLLCLSFVTFLTEPCRDDNNKASHGAKPFSVKASDCSVTIKIPLFSHLHGNEQLTRSSGCTFFVIERDNSSWSPVTRILYLS